MSTADANWYSRQIKRVPMLTAAEEITLGTQVQKWLSEENPSPGLARRGRRAKDRMVEANLRLVVTVANKYLHKVPASDFMDLVQAGNIGLVRAVEKYDPTRGYKFSTYAYWWIRQGISRHVETQTRLIRLPASTTQKLYQLASITRRLVQELHRSPSKAELAQALEVSIEDLELLITRGQACISLDASANGKDHLSTIGDLIADTSGIGLDEQLEQLEEANTTTHLMSYLDELNPRQRLLVEGTIGLGQPMRTITELAKEMGINTAQASKLLREAKMRLRWLASSRGSSHCPKSSPPPLPTAYVELNQLEIIDTITELVPKQEHYSPCSVRKRRDQGLVVQPSFW
jgi:RNA polymerase primary sigma factor